MQPPPELSDAEVCALVRQLSERLEIEPPRLELSDRLMQERGSPAGTERGGGCIFFDRWLLREHGQRPYGVWAVIAHEVAHVYWDQHPDVCSGFAERYEDEDGADYVAGNSPRHSVGVPARRS